MLNQAPDLKNIVLPGFRKLGPGIVRYTEGNMRIVRVSVWSAKSHEGKPWMEMTQAEKKAFDDYLYLSNIQHANTKIIYV